MKIYNKKEFLLPDSHRSMSCFHAKVLEDNIMKLTIHDCKRAVQFHNNLNDKEELEEAILKLTNLETAIRNLRIFIEKKQKK